MPATLAMTDSLTLTTFPDGISGASTCAESSNVSTEWAIIGTPPRRSLSLHPDATGKPVAKASSGRWIWVVHRGSFVAWGLEDARRYRRFVAAGHELRSPPVASAPQTNVVS